MQESSDAQLLRRYAEAGDEAAFREIVARHTHVVYASALRQINSPDLARDVAQTVFVDLARKAKPLTAAFDDGSSLLGWLYRSTRFAALTLWRNEQRRQTKERRVAMEQLNSIEPAAEWEQIGPMLDEAMADLADADREAILLRFFKNLDFRTVGAALGVSDDAAQKRVSRALERLRGYLARRGVTTTALALSAALSAQAAPAAPAGLATGLAAAALACTTAAYVASAATFTIAMTTMQKALVGATLAAALGVGIYQTQKAAQLRAEVQALGATNAPLSAQLHDLSNQMDTTSNQLAALREENVRLRSQLDELPRLRGELARLRAGSHAEQADADQAAANSWLERVNLLKQRLEQMPQAKIADLQLATEQDWLDAAKGQLDTDTDYRRAFSFLRGAVENKVVSLLKPALDKYLDAHGGKFPTSASDLQDYLSSPLDPAILQRWQVAPATDLPSLGMGGDWIITEGNVVDEEYDQRRALGPHGTGNCFSHEPPGMQVLVPTLKAYLAASNGQEPSDPSQLQPYAATASQRSALQHLVGQFSSMSPEQRDALLQKMQQLK